MLFALLIWCYILLCYALLRSALLWFASLCVALKWFASFQVVFALLLFALLCYALLALLQVALLCEAMLYIALLRATLLGFDLICVVLLYFENRNHLFGGWYHFAVYYLRHLVNYQSCEEDHTVIERKLTCQTRLYFEYDHVVLWCFEIHIHLFGEWCQIAICCLKRLASYQSYVEDHTEHKPIFQSQQYSLYDHAI